MVASSLKADVLRGYHDEAGHQGQYCVLQLSHQCFYWTDIECDVCDYVKVYCRYVLVKTQSQGRALSDFLSGLLLNLS